MARGDVNVPIVIGTCYYDDDAQEPGAVLIDFRQQAVDYVKLTPEHALDMAEGLALAADEAEKDTIALPLEFEPLRIQYGTAFDDNGVPCLVLMDWRPHIVDHIKLTPREAREHAVSLIEAARKAGRGRLVPTSHPPLPN